MSNSDRPYILPLWHNSVLEQAHDALDRALVEIHPEHGEHDKVRAAMSALEDADIALERVAKWRTG